MIIHIQETDNIRDCLALRMTVFVEEQKVPQDEELDDLDDVSTHFIATTQDGVPVGTARIYQIGDVGKIGRVCVLSSHRGTGLGAQLVKTCIAALREKDGIKTAKLGAQNHAIPFYERLGFTVKGGEYMDGGIPHHDMVLSL
ncbi:ElaA protein [Pacificibacter maritimus]|uniref:ElaA protein n=1 Tax=Pacificibacter maritimus TaxID=762213 RepID=A0A3N4UQY8_9RHOB|nr:GNAT family N-acetyltransferase [Pacificibacter maritimus]RPE63104.1 ElaA protein [Pacificibacter maritimus]